MKYHTRVFLVITFISLVSWMQSAKVRRINLYNDQVSIEVPAAWQIKEKYRRYSHPQIKYDIKISDNKTKSTLTVDVYDSTYLHGASINNGLIENYENAQLKTKGKSLNFIEKKVIRIDDRDVGVLKYTFRPATNKLCYGAQFFFRDSGNYFYEIEVYSLRQSTAEFKKTVDTILASLRLRPSS